MTVLRRPPSLGTLENRAVVVRSLALRRMIQLTGCTVGSRAAYAAVLFSLCHLDRDAGDCAGSTTGSLPGKNPCEGAEPHFASNEFRVDVVTPIINSDLFGGGESHGVITSCLRVVVCQLTVVGYLHRRRWRCRSQVPAAGSVVPVGAVTCHNHLAAPPPGTWARYLRDLDPRIARQKSAVDVLPPLVLQEQ